MLLKSIFCAFCTPGGALELELRNKLLQLTRHRGQTTDGFLRLSGTGRGALGRGGHTRYVLGDLCAALRWLSCSGYR